MNRQFTYSLNCLYDNSTLTGQLLQDNTYKYDNVGNIISIDDNGLNVRNQYFEYDNTGRLIYSKGGMNYQGTGIGYETDYTYSAAGRILRKNVTSQRMNTTAGLYPMDYQNNYTYTSTGNPFAISSVQDALSGSVNNFDWDANGNLIKSSCISGPAYDRRLCWTEDNRLQGYTEYSDENGDMSAWYNYNAGGDRNFKITSPSLNIRQNAVGLRYSAHLKYPTLYASALITFNKGGYTKHYFEGTNRVCSKIGGGFSNINLDSIEDRIPTLVEDYDQLSEGQRESVERTFGECLGIGVEMDGAIDLYEVIAHESGRDDQEPAFFYHSDHLGSAAYLTNDAGQVTQTLNYLPYGEDWVDIQNHAETRYPRLGIYRFNGKDPRKGWRIPLDEIKYNEQKDYESGFHYYSARYYWSEVLTGWLSVDPMMDEYPGLSPYNYCIWNPAKLNDPNGEDPVFFGLLQYQGIAKYGNSHLGETQQIGNFQVTPFYDNNNNLLGYNAGRYRSDGSFVNEYQMEPGDIKMFSQNVKTYEDAANLVYCAGEPDWSYVAFGSYLTTGNYHAALSELGKMWGNALSSPSFYIASTLSVLSMSKTSSVKQILRDIRNIESSGGYVKINPLNPRNNQQINMTIGNSSRKIDLRIESHPLPKKMGGNGVSPQPHMNVDYYENGVKIKTDHIILEQ